MPPKSKLSKGLAFYSSKQRAAAFVVGRLLWDVHYRNAFIADPNKALKVDGVKLDASAKKGLTKVAKDLAAGKLGTNPVGSET